jgi:hypothetical protein
LNKNKNHNAPSKGGVNSDSDALQAKVARKVGSREQRGENREQRAEMKREGQRGKGREQRANSKEQHPLRRLHLGGGKGGD